MRRIRCQCGLIATSIFLLAATGAILAQNSSEGLLDSLKYEYESGGMPAVQELIDRVEGMPGQDSSLTAETLTNLAIHIFQNGDRKDATDLLEGAKGKFPDNTVFDKVLGQFYWYTNNRAGCIASFKKVLSIDSTNSLARRYWDLLFFVPEDFDPPESLLTQHLKIRPLTVSDAELDYRAVMGSRDHIRGVFGPDDDWPSEDLTLEDDIRALKNHETEHKRKAAFTYTVMNHDESECLGCVYIIPVHMNEFDAQIYMWATKDAYEKGWDTELYKELRTWIAEKWPFDKVAYPGREIDWDTWNGFVEY